MNVLTRPLADSAVISWGSGIRSVIAVVVVMYVISELKSKCIIYSAVVVVVLGFFLNMNHQCSYALWYRLQQKKTEHNFIFYSRPPYGSLRRAHTHTE